MIRLSKNFFGATYIELQEQYRDRLIETSETTEHADQSAA
jgi:hypothetical protein